MNDMQLAVRLPSTLVSRLDTWRAQQPIVPTRTQAIRSFIETVLDEDYDRLEAFVGAGEENASRRIISVDNAAGGD